MKRPHRTPSTATKLQRPSQLLLPVLVLFMVALAGACSLDALIGTTKPQEQQRAAECGQMTLVTVADSTLPPEAQAFYPKVVITINTCPKAK